MGEALVEGALGREDGAQRGGDFVSVLELGPACGNGLQRGVAASEKAHRHELGEVSASHGLVGEQGGEFGEFGVGEVAPQVE